VAINVVHVLEEDPGLAAMLDENERAVASQHLVAAELRVPRGTWTPTQPLGQARGDLGYLVLDGLLARETVLGRHTTAELLGSGDLLRPWDHHSDDTVHAPLDTHHAWRVLQPLRLAVLDARFGALCGRLPPVTAELLSRTLRRSRLLGLLLALSAMPRLDARLLALLWHLADRWGTVGTEGTLVPLRLTHATLAQLVGAQRPSVTSALRQLEERGLLSRVEHGGGFLLLGDPPGDPEQALAAAESRPLAQA
jgi:CRP/FNR family transcriptional regulator, cyclic AMP receptor protein